MVTDYYMHASIADADWCKQLYGSVAVDSTLLSISVKQTVLEDFSLMYADLIIIETSLNISQFIIKTRVLMNT